MSKKIPISVTSTVTKPSGNVPLVVDPYANNTGKTGDVAPILISVKSERQIDAATFAAAMVKNGGQGTEAQARLFFNSMFAVLGDLVDENGAVTVETPFGTVETFIAGSLANAQEQVDPDANYAFLGVRVNKSITNAISALEATIVSGSCPATVRRVMDKATGELNKIHGTDEFYIDGDEITLGGEGEKVELYDETAKVKVADVTVIDHTSLAHIIAKLAPTTTIPKGKYFVRVTTTGGGEQLWPVGCKATLVEDAEPSSDGPTVSGITPDKLDFGQTGDKITGTGLDLAEGDTLKLQLIEGGSVSETVDLTAKITAKSDSSITFDMPERGDVDDPNAWYDEDNEKNLVITKSGYAPVEFAVEFDA